MEPGIKPKQQYTGGAMMKIFTVKIAVKEEMPQNIPHKIYVEEEHKRRPCPTPIRSQAIRRAKPRREFEEEQCQVHECRRVCVDRHATSPKIPERSGAKCDGLRH